MNSPEFRKKDEKYPDYSEYRCSECGVSAWTNRKDLDEVRCRLCFCEAKDLASKSGEHVRTRIVLVNVGDYVTHKRTGEKATVTMVDRRDISFSVSSPDDNEDKISYIGPFPLDNDTWIPQLVGEYDAWMIGGCNAPR